MRRCVTARRSVGKTKPAARNGKQRASSCSDPTERRSLAVRLAPPGVAVPTTDEDDRESGRARSRNPFERMNANAGVVTPDLAQFPVHGRSPARSGAALGRVDGEAGVHAELVMAGDVADEDVLPGREVERDRTRLADL